MATLQPPDERAVAPYTTYASDITAAQVIALKATGHTYREIERIAKVSRMTAMRIATSVELGQKLSEEVQRYVQQMRGSALSKLSRLVDRRLDRALYQGEHLTDQQLFVGWGIASDKDHQSKQGKTSTAPITIIFNTSPVTIEGELA